MRKQTVILLAILCAICFLTGAVAAQSQTSSRPTIITVPCAEKNPLWHEKIYEDDNYLFVYQDFGKAEYAPVLLVYGKKQKKWTQIEKLSTEGAELGLLSSVAAKVKLLSSRDDNSLRNTKYIDLPLRVSGSINFPDKITYDKKIQTYIVYFALFSKGNEKPTRFQILKTDLERALN